MIPEHILQRFTDVMQQVEQADFADEPTAMMLTTVDADAKPSTRVVLLKTYDEAGFVFYTNCNSRKGNDLLVNPNVALTFYWGELRQQIRIEGIAVQVSDKEADDYWATRAKGSQIGAWASHQSEALKNRDELEARVQQYEEKFAHQEEVPRPEFWSGYRVDPNRIEFWSACESRLHVRNCHIKDNEQWRELLLSP